MRYNNDEVRRQDRLLAEEEARLLLREGEHGVLSMVNETGDGAYGIPVNFAWNGEDTIYLHCAPAGRKLKCLERCQRVSFCVVGKTRVIPNRFTTEYASVVARCRAEIGLPPEERMEALKLILAKYSPNDQEIGLKYAEKSFHRTEIIRLTVEEFSGKCKRVSI